MNKNYRFMYLRDSYEPLKKSAPIGCIVIGLTDNKQRVTYQVSVCNPTDEFDRASGRQLALGRLIEKPRTLTVGVRNPTMHDITREVMIDLERAAGVPMRARKAATKWLDSVNVYFDLSDRDDYELVPSNGW